MVHFDDNSLMPVGKYKGYKLANVPPDHLLWRLENNMCYGALKEYIERNKTTLEQEIKMNRKQKYR